LAPLPVRGAPPEFVEAVLADVDIDAYALDLRGLLPAPIRRWLDAPATTRLIGPHYDPEQDAAYHMCGGSLADWFDVIIHSQETTPIRPL
jgi:erythromycin esterase